MYCTTIYDEKGLKKLRISFFFKSPKYESHPEMLPMIWLVQKLL